MLKAASVPDRAWCGQKPSQFEVGVGQAISEGASVTESQLSLSFGAPPSTTMFLC